MAIAFVRSADGGFNNSSGSFTFTISCTGASALLVGVTWTGSGLTVSSDLDGALTQEAHLVQAHNPYDDWLFSLKAPTTGTHTITVTKGSGTALASAVAGCWSGTDTTTPVEAVATLETFSVTTNWPISLTTLTDQAWTVLFADCAGAGGSLSAATGATSRQVETALFGSQVSLYDSGAAISPAGSTTMNLTTSFNTQYMHGIIASLKQAGGGGGFFGSPLAAIRAGHQGNI